MKEKYITIKSSEIDYSPPKNLFKRLEPLSWYIITHSFPGNSNHINIYLIHKKK